MIHWQFEKIIKNDSIDFELQILVKERIAQVLHFPYQTLFCMTCFLNLRMTQSAGTAEYTNCIFAEG